MPTPRVFLVRHGETEWSSRDLHTGSTDLPLTENGQCQAHATSQALVGDGRLIQPKNILKIYTSPRLRARQTVKCLNLVGENRLPWDRSVQTMHLEPSLESRRGDATVYVSDDLQEWDYGDYEGLTIAEVREKRRERGQDKDWNVWEDGCEGGELPAQVAIRLDHLIADIKNQFNHTSSTKKPSDVVCVAHSHILSAFALRWVERPIEDGIRLLLDTAGVAILSNEHHDMREPAIIIGPHF